MGRLTVQQVVDVCPQHLAELSSSITLVHMSREMVLLKVSVGQMEANFARKAQGLNLECCTILSILLLSSFVGLFEFERTLPQMSSCEFISMTSLKVFL